MLLVATLFVGGCHRNKPASKAPRATAPVRSSSPKEVKPAVISVTPVPIHGPVVVPAVRKEQFSVRQDKDGSGSKVPEKAVASPSATLKRTEQLKPLKSAALSAPVPKTIRTKEIEVSGPAKESPKPTVEATTDLRMPWERPLYEPAASKGQKVKSEQTSKVQEQKGKQASPDAVLALASEPKTVASPLAETASASDSASKQEAPPKTASPLVTAPDATKGGETVFERPANHPGEAVSKSSSDVSAESSKFVSKKSARVQSAPASVGSLKETEVKKSEEPSEKKVEELSVVAGAAALPKPMEPTLATEALAPTATKPPEAASSTAGSKPDSIPEPVLPVKPLAEVAKDIAASQKVAIVAPKKLSDAERKEAVRRQANDSYQSGQQLIRESRNAEAMQALKQTVKLVPESADAWLRIAYLLEREGKLDEARRAFKEAKKFWSF